MFLLFQLAIFNMGWEGSMLGNGASSVLAPIIPEKTIHLEKSSSTNEKLASVLGEPQYFVISSKNDEVYKNVIKTLALIKRPYAAYTSLDQLPQEISSDFVGLVICDANLDEIGNIDVLFSYAEKGKETIFARRLTLSAKNYQRYFTRFGIVYSAGMYEHTGVDFLNKIFISGLFFNANLTTLVNDVTLSGKCQVFAVCADEKAPPYADKTPVIWRTYWSGGAMYFFNNDFMEDFYSVGMFIGVVSMDKDVFLHPIINASSVSLNGLPYLSNESDENMLKTYNRDTVQFQADTIWTDLLSITKQFNLKYTLYPKVGDGQADAEDELLESIGKMVAVNNFEIGVYPSEKFKTVFPNYERAASSYYITGDTKSRIVSDIRNFSYSSDGYVNLPIISSTTTGKREKRAAGEEPDNLNRFRMFSFASGLGYVSHSCDFTSIFSDKEGEDLWSGYKVNFIEEYYPVSQTYDYIDITNASEMAERVRIFLDMVPEINILENEIIVKGQEMGETYYIMRTARRIIDTVNCSVINLKDDFYLVKVSRADALIYTKRGI